MADRKNEARWIESRCRWQINVQKDGQRKTFTSTITGKKGKIACEKKADLWLSSNTVTSNIRLEKMWQQYLEHLKPDENGKSANGSGYANFIKLQSIGNNHILPNLKTKKLCNITQADWQACIDKAYKKGLSKKTLKNIRGKITVFYNFAADNGIALQPLRQLKIHEAAPVKGKRILQPAELHTLFTEDTVTIYGKEAECFYIHAFRFLVLTGLRRGELCGLMRSDISGENSDIIHINRSINEYKIETTCKNENARRWFILPLLAQKELQAQQQLLRKGGIISPYLFPNEYGECLDPKELYRHWKRYREQHRISCSLHELRHTMISLNKSTVPPALLKQVVGHSAAMDTFGIYGHEVDGEKQLATNIINQTLQNYIK